MVFDVQTYTCITFLSNTNKPKKYFQYTRITEPVALKQLSSLMYSPVFYDNLNVKKWRLMTLRDQENIARIESQPQKLGAITNIHSGIATLKDSIYFVDGQTVHNGYYEKLYQEHTFLIEASITKPIARISDFKRQEELISNTRRIIFPYNVIGKNAQLIPEETMLRKFPKCYEYLKAAKDKLSTRDKSQRQYPAWYAYARTQGLVYYGCKLLTPTFSRTPRFMLDTKEDQLFCNGYAIYLKNPKQLSLLKPPLSLEVLQKILNSRIMEYYISQTSYTIEGGYPCYQKNFIELFGIPNFAGNDLCFLEHESHAGAINEFLIQKYGISL
jgi:hypothetical protein